MTSNLTSDLKAHYEAVLNDLEGERTGVRHEISELHRRLRDLDYNIASLSRRVGLAPPIPASRPAAPHGPSSQHQKYARISVRWAILHLLSESEPMATSDIADTLKANGVITRAANFINNVSAVLSTTMKGAGEVEMIEGRWRLTDKGWSAIHHIKTSPKFIQACPWAGVPDAATPGAHQHERR